VNQSKDYAYTGEFLLPRWVEMSDSLRPMMLSCPRCKKVVEVQVPRVVSITYTCDGCGAVVEHSLVTGAVAIKGKGSPSS
jgi:lysyl-tRNA synthetase class I